MMNNRWMVTIMFTAAVALTGMSCAAKDPGPIVLELFTSEGCSSCPPADTLLSQVVKRDPSSIAGLSEHVDYWNWLGWKDPKFHF